MYENLDAALAAALEQTDARKSLAARGPSYVLVADVRRVGERYELGDVSVVLELDSNVNPNRHIVLRVDGRICPVCGRVGDTTHTWARPAVASGNLMTGLDPVHCVGCHDTLTTR
jgi:hypothetical protein